MKQYLIDQIQHLDEKKKELQNDLKTYVQDKSLPLSDRWEIFCLAANIIPKEGSIVEFKYMKINKLFTNYSRYEEIDLLNLVDYIEYEDKTLEDVDSLKEEILDKFIGSFKLDW